MFVFWRCSWSPLLLLPFCAVAGSAMSELKFNDVSVNVALADLSAGVIAPSSGSLVLLGQNAGASGRIGRQVLVESVAWRVELTLIATAASTLAAAQSCRLLLVFDAQCNRAAAAVAGTGGVLDSASFLSFTNVVEESRFTVLFDRTFVLAADVASGNGTANDTSASKEVFDWIYTDPFIVEYEGTAADITDISEANLFIVMINSTASAFVSLASNVRIRFSDVS